MKVALIFVIVFFRFGMFFGQKKLINPAENFNKKRFIFTSLTLSTCYIGSTYALNNMWYSDFQKSKFHFFNDGSEWLQMDKIGHAYTTNKLANAFTHQFLWTGLDSNKSTFLGSALSFTFQTTIEILDGKSSGWGFSWYDMSANTAGLLMFSLQQIYWKEQRILLKFSNHFTPYAKIRPEVLGYTRAERVLKDYNGQTYWVSFSPQLFFPALKIPGWACISLGYGIDKKISGKNNFYVDPITDISYQAHRQFLVSLDIDFSKLPIRNQVLKKILKPFNLLKIPFPTLIFSPDNVQGRLLYF